MMSQTYAIYACTDTITRVISFVHVIFCGSWKQGFSKVTLEVNLIGRKYRVNGAI